MRRSSACALALSMGVPAFAHQLEGYLQATTLSLGRSRVWAYLRLTPGVNAFRQVVPRIDANGDGIVSAVEGRAYAAAVLGDLSFSVDGHPLVLRPLSAKFPTVEAMRNGVGDVELTFDASLPKGAPRRRLTFENRHRRDVASYLVNLLAPDDSRFRIVGQRRDVSQSRYELDYVSR